MKVNLILLSIILSSSLLAQETDSGASFDLQQCVDYALDNSVQSRNSKIDVEIANARVKETVGIGLPQIDGSVSAQYSPTQQRFFGQYDPNADLFGLGQRNPNIEAGDVGAAENFFQLKGAGDASLNVNQLVFNGSYIVGLQASKAYKDLSVKNLDQTQEEVTLNVSKAFYNVLISRERLDLVESNLRRIDTLFRNTEAMYQNGFAEKLDVDRIKVTRNNLRVSRQELHNLVEISMKLLKFQMNYPYDQQLVLVGGINDELVDMELPDAEGWDYAERPDYRVLQSNYELQKLNIRNKYAEAIPSISAFANLGYSTQSPDFSGIFTTNADFEDLNGVGPDKWYRYSLVGLRMNWSIFTGLQRSYKIQQEKLSLLQIENGFESLEKSIDLEIDQTQRNLKIALDKLDVQRENMELANEIYNVTRIKYEEGVGSNLEVIEADNSLKEAQTNYYNALFDAIIAKLDLDKALGNIKN